MRTYTLCEGTEHGPRQSQLRAAADAWPSPAVMPADVASANSFAADVDATSGVMYNMAAPGQLLYLVDRMRYKFATTNGVSPDAVEIRARGGRMDVLMTVAHA